MVARAVLSSATSPKPRRRYLVGRDARLLRLLHTPAAQLVRAGPAPPVQPRPPPTLRLKSNIRGSAALVICHRDWHTLYRFSSQPAARTVRQWARTTPHHSASSGGRQREMNM